MGQNETNQIACAQYGACEHEVSAHGMAPADGSDEEPLLEAEFGHEAERRYNRRLGEKPRVQFLTTTIQAFNSDGLVKDATVSFPAGLYDGPSYTMGRRHTRHIMILKTQPKTQLYFESKQDFDFWDQESKRTREESERTGAPTGEPFKRVEWIRRDEVQPEMEPRPVEVTLRGMKCSRWELDAEGRPVLGEDGHPKIRRAGLNGLSQVELGALDTSANPASHRRPPQGPYKIRRPLELSPEKRKMLDAKVAAANGRPAHLAEDAAPDARVAAAGEASGNASEVAVDRHANAAPDARVAVAGEASANASAVAVDSHASAALVDRVPAEEAGDPPGGGHDSDTPVPKAAEGKRAGTTDIGGEQRRKKVDRAPTSATETLSEYVISELRQRPPNPERDELIRAIKSLPQELMRGDVNRTRFSAGYNDVRDTLKWYKHHFSYELCEPCHAICDNVLYLPPAYKPNDPAHDTDSDAEYVHPHTLTHEQFKRQERQPAWSEHVLCTLCGERPRNGDDTPFARGTKIVDGQQRFDYSTHKFHTACADASVIKDSRKMLTTAHVALAYTGSDSSEFSRIRTERLGDIHTNLINTAAAVKERIAGGVSERSTPVTNSCDAGKNSCSTANRGLIMSTPEQTKGTPWHRLLVLKDECDLVFNLVRGDHASWHEIGRVILSHFDRKHGFGLKPTTDTGRAKDAIARAFSTARAEPAPWLVDQIVSKLSARRIPPKQPQASPASAPHPAEAPTRKPGIPPKNPQASPPYAPYTAAAATSKPGKPYAPYTAGAPTTQPSKQYARYIAEAPKPYVPYDRDRSPSGRSRVRGRSPADVPPETLPKRRRSADRSSTFEI